MTDDLKIPQARIGEIRSAIHQHLRDHDVYGQIREIMSAHAADHTDFNPNSPDDVVKVLKERGIVNEILGSFGSVNVSRKVAVSRASNASTALVSNALRANQRHLIVRLVGGRAFLDALDRTVLAADGHASSDDAEQFVVHLHFGDQRCRSTPKPFVVDPDFDDDFLFQFPSSLRDLLECDVPLHLLVTREDKYRRRALVVGENLIDWRRVLKTGSLNVAVELAGDNPGVPQGIVELQLEIVPMTLVRKATEEDVVFHIERSRSNAVAADREFLLYARRWWAELHGMRSDQSQRHVKVFAPSSNGRMLPITHYVYPVQPDRVISSPDDAARFVSLLGVDQSEDVAKDVMRGGRAAGGGGGAGGSSASSGEQWLAPFVFLSQRHGDAVNHATLLASLLLGFGLDAYCAMGTGDNAGDEGASKSASSSSRAVLVVITRRKTGARSFEATIWNPVSGHRFAADGAHGLHSIDCVFNDSALFANISGASGVSRTTLDFDDETAWLPMSPMKLRIVPRVTPPPLLYIPTNVRDSELELEASLRSAWQDHREKLSMTTTFNGELSFILGQALSKYEASRRGVIGAAAPTVDLSLFHQSVKGTIGEGRSFKGFPINVTHINPKRIFAAIVANASGRDVVELNGDDMSFGVRVMVTEFAEGVVSVWVMLCARYRSLSA